MYKSAATLTGAIIAVMLFSNAVMVEMLGNTPAVFINHLIGICAAFAVLVATKAKWQSLKGIPVFYLTAGITGLLTVYLSNIAFLAIGATLTLMLSMFSRIVVSTVIDHFGLMGMTPFPFNPKKTVGLLLMIAGVTFLVIG